MLWSDQRFVEWNQNSWTYNWPRSGWPDFLMRYLVTGVRYGDSSRLNYLGVVSPSKPSAEGGSMGGLSLPQLTRGSGGASWSPTVGSGATPQPETHFGIFLRPQNAPFCTYVLWVGGQVRGLGLVVPLHQHRNTPDEMRCWTQWLSDRETSHSTITLVDFEQA